MGTSMNWHYIVIGDLLLSYKFYFKIVYFKHQVNALAPELGKNYSLWQVHEYSFFCFNIPMLDVVKSDDLFVVVCISIIPFTLINLENSL
jgi:hypothetical protein